MGGSEIPKFDGFVNGAGSQDLLLRWTPLDIFDTILVALESDLGFLDEGRAVLVSWGIKVKHGVTRSRSKTTKLVRTPVDGITLLFVLKLSDFGTTIALFLRLLLFLFVL